MSAAYTALLDAEQRWELVAPRSYQFTVNYSAFILQYGCKEQSFLVENGRSKSDAPRDCRPRKDVLGTIPALFKLARELIEGYLESSLTTEADTSLTMEFDPHFGYPTKFHIGSEVIEDWFFHFQVTAFEVTYQ